MGGCDGYLHLVDVSDGARKKKIDLGAYVGASPAVLDGRVYVGTFADEILAIEVHGGRIFWRYKDPQRAFPLLRLGGGDGGESYCRRPRQDGALLQYLGRGAFMGFRSQDETGLLAGRRRRPGFFSPPWEG